MVDAVIYFILGIMDVIAVFVLMFKIFRLPIREYWVEISILSAVISIISYLLRVVMEIPAIDPILQLTLFVLFMRSIIKIRLFPSVLLSFSGIIAYAAIQFLVFYILIFLGLLHENDAQENSLYLLQICAQSTSYLIGYLIYRFNFGFTFVNRPPHAFFIKEKMTRSNVYLMLWLMVGIMLFVGTMVSIYSNLGKMIVVIPITCLSFIILLYLANRRDKAK